MAAVRRGAWIGPRYVTTLFFVGVIVQFFLTRTRGSVAVLERRLGALQCGECAPIR